jgi:hypothetical protein
VHILTGIFGGEKAASDLTPAWDGGVYWAGQLRNATPVEQASTKSIALLYLSAWKNSESAQAFVTLYAAELGRKYSGLKLEKDAPKASADNTEQQVYSTNEGPVVISRRGKLVFVTESFNLDLARSLATLVLDSQGAGDLKLAAAPYGPGIQSPSHAPALVRASWDRIPSNPAQPGPTEPLSGSLVRFFSDCGVMKFAVDAAVQSIR